jgi:hypothetical protein
LHVQNNYPRQKHALPDSGWVLRQKQGAKHASKAPQKGVVCALRRGCRQNLSVGRWAKSKKKPNCEQFGFL